jgi:hypothetical protein
LIDQGAQLQEGDVGKLDARLQREVTAVDLTADTVDEDIEDAQGMRSSTNQEQGVIVLKGCFVKDAMQRLIAPELQAMEKAYPGSLKYWEKYGVDIVLAADGIAYARFMVWYQKLEMGGAKIIAP